MDVIAAFPNSKEFDKAKSRLEAQGLPYVVVDHGPGYAFVAAPALIVSPATRAALCAQGKADFVCSGWVDYRPARVDIQRETPPRYSQDLFGQASVMVLTPCIADPTKIRLIAHLSGDMTKGFPYLNADRREVCYNPNGPLVTFMDQYRMVTLYPRRIAIAKADEIIDGWRVLEMVRRRINEVWSRRDTIEPSDQMRQKPAALEIYWRLPGTNCRTCGEKTCMAFALRLWSGDVRPSQCAPTFAGEFINRKEALLEICAGLGNFEGDPEVQRL